MNKAGFVLEAIGILMVIVSFVVGVIFERRPNPPPERRNERFTRDVALFGSRLLGAVLILMGSVVFIIASRHAPP
jgi:uncharacterized membrane protein